jgi:hypothetical protein
MCAEVQPLQRPATRLGPCRDSAGAGPILYHTVDPVNLAWLEELAAARGLAVEQREPRDGLAPAGVLLVDADFWWTDRAERERGLLDLVNRQGPAFVVAVHGWQLDDEQVAWLRQNGVHADHRLDHEFVALLDDELAGEPLPSG